MVKLNGRMLALRSGILLLGLVLPEAAAEPPRLFVSMILREAMIMSMSHSWNRSTTSAHVSWKRLSFSNFLKTVDLISTNWLDIRRVNSALE